MEIDLDDISHQAKKQALKKVYSSFFYDSIMDNPSQFLREIEDDELIQYIDNKREFTYGFAMLTVNPREKTSYEEFRKKINKALRKKMVTRAIYCIEWRRGNVGMHMHALIELSMKKKPSHMQREFYNTFKTIVEKTFHVNIKATHTPKNFRKYILGYKEGEYKPNHDQDVINRVALGIPDVIYYPESDTPEASSSTCKDAE